MCRFIKVFKLQDHLVNCIEMLYGMSDLISYISDRVAVEQVFLIFCVVQCKLSCCTVLVCLWPQECLLAQTRQYIITVKMLAVIIQKYDCPHCGAMKFTIPIPIYFNSLWAR